MPYLTIKALFIFLIKTLIYAGAVYYTTNQFTIDNLGTVILGVFILSLPIILCGTYGSTVRQIRRLTIFKERGILFKIVSSRFLKSILWILWALSTSFFMLLQFHTYSEWEWFFFLLVIPFFWIVFSTCRKFIAHEIVGYMATDIALRWARFLCPILMLILYYAFFGQFETLPNYANIPEAIQDQKSRVENLAGSTITREASHFLALYDGIRIFILNHSLSQDTIWGFLLLTFSKLIVFFNACAILSCFVIPTTEFRRIVGPLTDQDIPPALSIQRIAIASAIFTLLTLFIYAPTFVYLEAWVQQKSIALNEDRTKIEKVAVDLIGEEPFRKGTIEKLHKAKIKALPDKAAIQRDLDEKLEIGFKRLESRVDIYLDWYYSLMGEYTRISKLLIGELEEDMKRRFQEALEQGGNPFWEYEAAVSQLLMHYEDAQKAYIEKANKILHKNRLDLKGVPFDVNEQLTLLDAVNLPIHQEDFINLQHRLGTGSAAGMITAIIVGKVAGKSIFKLAVGALFKVVASKATGAVVSAGAGAATGAAVGSVVPGLGTAIGAVIGGIIGGIGAGIIVDKTLIELEAAISREKFKAEILAAINEARLEFKEKLINPAE
ncbi:MAG TPA: hypothetical protein PKD88_09445 [Nitrosomonas sp.]|nr:hypothetical protein [Nitrosomonas sp.]HMW21222.1 hypothetical protein [Nitrosomonas sp.]HMY90019.1 hypothetical protein [Nitrosomonas sp.]HNA71531.1 hypothetical protein [Nitrosomonas sp.]HNB02318.1 hypothetical protein [Nitrosomonas sp.]